MTSTPSDFPIQRNQRERRLAWLIMILLTTVLATLALMASDRSNMDAPAPAPQERHD